jgi:hypothetical protein
MEGGHVVQGACDNRLFLVIDMISVDSFPLEEGERESSLDHQTISSLSGAKSSTVQVDEQREATRRQ